MSNEYYYACGGCEFLLGSNRDNMKCPHCTTNVGVEYIGVAEEYDGIDDEHYNKGFPYGLEHKCDRCDNGKLDLNFDTPKRSGKQWTWHVSTVTTSLMNIQLNNAKNVW